MPGTKRSTTTNSGLLSADQVVESETKTKKARTDVEMLKESLLSYIAKDVEAAKSRLRQYEHEKAACEDEFNWEGVVELNEAMAVAQERASGFFYIEKAMKSEDPCKVLDNAIFVHGEDANDNDDDDDATAEPSTIQIFVRLPSGSIILNALPTDTMHDLRVKIEGKAAHYPASACLGLRVANGSKRLDNDSTVASMGLTSDDTLELLRGGRAGTLMNLDDLISIGMSKSTTKETATLKSRAQNAIYSGPFKLTPTFRHDPINALPFDGVGMMTQKMDGMFLLWDGKSQACNRGRGGVGSINYQNPPASWCQKLPPVELEGELCYRSGEYSRGHAAMKKGWKNACLFVFDAPRHPGTYEERFAYLKELLSHYDSRYVQLVPYLGVADSRRKMNATLTKVRAMTVPRKYGTGGYVGAQYKGGEGVMIRDPCARYVYACHQPRVAGHKKGQSPAIYKWLEEYGSDECLVVGVVDGRCNSLTCELPNGTRFELDSISRLGVDASNIDDGSIVTVEYHGWENGVPVRPSAQAFRTDRTWDDIVATFIPPPTLKEHSQAKPKSNKRKSSQTTVANKKSKVAEVYM